MDHSDFLQTENVSIIRSSRSKLFTTREVWVRGPIGKIDSRTPTPDDLLDLQIHLRPSPQSGKQLELEMHQTTRPVQYWMRHCVAAARAYSHCCGTGSEAPAWIVERAYLDACCV